MTAPIGPGATYTANSPNMWSTASADEALGLVYVPLGNQTPDQLGAGRSASVEKFSSSITALDLATGQVRWVRQTVHHDLWDMDVPAQPTLIDLTIAGQTVPALVGPTKQGGIMSWTAGRGRSFRSPRSPRRAARSKVRPHRRRSPSRHSASCRSR